MAEAPIEQPRPKSFSDLHDLPQEALERYFQIPGWRIWSRGLRSPDSKDYHEAHDDVESKSLALMATGRHESKSAYRKIQDKLGIPPPIFGGGIGILPYYYVLEPLDADTVKKIDEGGKAPGPLGSVDKPEKIVRPEDIRTILEALKN